MNEHSGYRVMVERYERRSGVAAIADEREEAMMEVLHRYGAVYEQSVGGVEIRHNDSHYSVLGTIREKSGGGLELITHGRSEIMESGGIEVRVSR
jgi:hypothetical protein